jgi:cell division protein FtsL
MPMLTLVSACLALASAFLLYGLNYDTRLMEQRVHAAERTAERTRSDISVLRAERAHLARPERIEPLARAQGLAPTQLSQMPKSPLGLEHPLGLKGSTNIADADPQ